MMNLQRLFVLVGMFACLSFFPLVAANDDVYAADDAYAQADDDSIVYWDVYAILPKRCIV
jgi:hypothetical protein